MTNEERDRLLMEIHTAVHSNTEVLKRHEKELFGNGRPGLSQRVDIMETCAKTKKESMTSIVAFITALGALAGFIWNASK